MNAMTKSRLLAAAAIFTAATAAPALADWQRIGTAAVTSDDNTTTHVTGVPAHINQLTFRANADVKCAAIRAEYANGFKQDLYSGTLFGGRDQIVYFPEGSREVTDVALDCRSESGGTARIALYGDTTMHRTAYPPPPVVTIDRGLVPVASRDFGDAAERSVMLPDPRPVEQVAIQPVDGDARCTRITARFDNGDMHEIVPNDGYRLHEGDIYRLQIADHPRDLNSIEMRCQASDTDSVKIRVFTST